MSALALIVAATLAQAGTLRSDLALRGGGAGRSVVALSAWDKGGSQDWGAGIPTPTIDCAPLPGSTGGDIVCSGASPTKAGSPTTGTSPFWYRGDAAVRPSVLESGSNYHTLGDVADASTAMTSCVAFNTSSVAGATYIAPKSASNAGYLIYASTTSLVLRVCNGTGCTSGGTVTISAGSWYVACHAYSHALGTIIGNANGVAGTPATSVAGPIADTSADLTIGTAGGAAVSVRRVAIWTGWAADAAQLAQLVATQWGLAADRPAGTVATHTRTDSTPCGPFSDSELYWLGPGAPCIHAPTYQGWASGGAVAGGIEVYGAGANSALQSQTLATSPWAKDASATVDVDACVAPDGTQTAERVSNTVATNIAYQAVTVPSGTTFTVTGWMGPDGASSTGTVGIACVGQNASACTCTGPGCAASRSASVCRSVATVTTWGRYSATVTCAAAVTQVALMAGGGNNVDATGSACFWGYQIVPTTLYPVPYRSTTGTPYAGIASTATTLTVPVALTDPARWAIAVTGTKGAATSSDDAYVFSLGAGATNWAYMHGGFFGVLDASGAQTYVPVTGGIPQGPNAILASYTAQTLGLTVNGTSRAGTQTTAGVGLTPMPTTLYVGNHYVATGKAWGGLVSRVVQCKRAGGCR